MSMISEQVADLREKAQIFEDSGCATNGIVKTFRKAADTIEELSAKLAINSQPPADQWIPCSKQEYPTEDGWYWITGKYDGWEEPETRLLVYAANVCGEFEWLKKQFELYNVTAWMPATLPEPYKGVE